MSTFNTRMTRGQTKVIAGVVKTPVGQLANLATAKIYFAMRADIKVAPSVQLTSDSLSSPWRTGIAIADQTGALKGRFTITLIPADTLGLVAMGDDDPWIYDVWMVDPTLGTIPVIERSNMGLYPEITTIP